eukprot:3663716-Amphidinium_carterae.1
MIASCTVNSQLEAWQVKLQPWAVARLQYAVECIMCAAQDPAIYRMWHSAADVHLWRATILASSRV